ncbi:MAG: hypothetical protein LiPW15_100 [Parcubacteria group bacterium LiPW_15]|nr:MAG: hypothetical protein LiPW15_100 [Parcubacteria group bacterium LiPW_15]
MSNLEEGAKTERGAEHIPSREEILGQIGKRSKRAEFLREFKDEDGINFLEAREPGEKTGESILYVYIRAGRFENSLSKTTTLQKVFIEENGDCRGGETIADYDNATGEWVEE